MKEPIKLFVGTDSNGGCAECQMVYEYSLRKHASVPVNLTWMKINVSDHGSPFFGWNTECWATPFSGFRWAIPEVCGFRGRAIYTDDDQLWLGDIAELFATNLDSKPYAAKLNSNGEIRPCVMVWDCERAKQFMPLIEKVKHHPYNAEIFKSIFFKRELVKFYDPNWNNYDGEDQPIEKIKILHFTDMATNPGIKMAVKRLGSQSYHWYDGPLRPHRRPDCEALFHQYYAEALDAGYKLEDYLPKEQIFYKKGSQKNYRANNGWG